MADHLLEVRNLSVEFHTVNGVVKAVRDISYHLDRGETLAILGESGSGKSVSSSAVMNLIDMPRVALPPARSCWMAWIF